MKKQNLSHEVAINQNKAIRTSNSEKLQGLITHLKTNENPVLGKFIDYKIYHAYPHKFPKLKFGKFKGVTFIVATFEKTKLFSFSLCGPKDNFARFHGVQAVLKRIEKHGMTNLDAYLDKSFDDYVCDHPLVGTPYEKDYLEILTANFLSSYKKYTSPPTLHEIELSAKEWEQEYFELLDKSFDQKDILDHSYQFIQLRIVRNKQTNFVSLATSSYLERSTVPYDIFPKGGITVLLTTVKTEGKQSVLVASAICSPKDAFSKSIGRVTALSNMYDKNIYEQKEYSAEVSQEEIFTDTLKSIHEKTNQVILYR